MDSPLSLIIADMVLQDLENRVIMSLPIFLPFYVRYVDDVELAVSSSMLKTVLNTFNAYHPRLQFILEEDENNRFNFLDVTIIVDNNHSI